MFDIMPALRVSALSLLASVGCSGGHATSGTSPGSLLPANVGATTSSSFGSRTTAAVNTNVPSHARNMAYWGQPSEPLGVSAAWIATHITMLMADAPHTRDFKSAGGQYAIGYTDPFRVFPPNDPLINMPEDAFLHLANGQRATASNGDGVSYGVNPASADAQSAYHNLTVSMASSAPYDFVEVDNVYFDLLGAFYQFNTYPGYPVEITTQANWDTNVTQMIQASAITPIADGMSNEDGQPAVSGSLMFLNVSAGGLDNEGCLVSTAAKTSTNWLFDENTLLAMSNQNKYAICQGQSAASDTRAARLMFYASWLLTYDANRSIAFANFAPTYDKNSSLFVFPEYQIVPTQPIQTASSNVSELAAGSVYKREFALCYQAQNAIGACAVIVNPSTSNANISSLTSAYSQSLQLDGYDTWNGGQATWQSSVPTTLASYTAVVLLNPGSSGGSGSNTLTGTIVASDPGYLVVQGCSGGGYVNAYYSSSTSITYNGASLQPGVRVSVSGSGDCATRYQASTIVLNP